MLTARRQRGFSILELIVSIGVIALLLTMLLPLLSRAREYAYRTVCASNLRQLNVGWQGYVQDNKDTFPQTDVQSDWRFGGVVFTGPFRDVTLAGDRPINKYIAVTEQRLGDGMVDLFRCPGDAGVYMRGSGARGRPGQSVLPNGANCFDTYGNSYRANPFLMDSTMASIDQQHRPLSLHEIHVDTSRLLVMGDPAWYYATIREDQGPELEAGWHTVRDGGNMLAADGSLRFVDFSKDMNFALHPRPSAGR